MYFIKTSKYIYFNYFFYKNKYKKYQLLGISQLIYIRIPKNMFEMLKFFMEKKTLKKKYHKVYLEVLTKH